MLSKGMVVLGGRRAQDGADARLLHIGIRGIKPQCDYAI